MATQDLDSLNRRFGVPNHVSFREGPGNFTIVELDNFHARASVCLEGGQVLTYQPAGHAPVLWISDEARYVNGKSVRGGVPVCWPWFGPHATDATKPAHGYARNLPWQVKEASALNDGATRLVLELLQGDAQRALWPHATTLQLHVSVGPNLMIELVTLNHSNEPARISEALHTYFHVSDIANVRICGLDRVSYVDKVANTAHATQNGDIAFAGEVDRVYVNTDATCVIRDSGLKREIHVAKQESRSTIIWNPWIDKAVKLGDMGPDGYRHMVCVETANALDNAVQVEPGAEHRLVTIIHAEAMN